MINSYLFSDITYYLDYPNVFDFVHNPLVLAVNRQYQELMEFEEALWNHNMKSGIQFEDHYGKFFPPGYIERDPTRARDIVNSLRQAVKSIHIRRDFPPICCYVMYQLIYELGPFVRLRKEFWLTKELQEYLERMPNQSKKRVSRTDTKRWFSDINIWLDDFKYTYYPDCVDNDEIEAYGELYLYGINKPQKNINGLSVDIESLSDLMPFDLRERVLKKVEEEKKQIPADEITVLETVKSACEKISANPIDFKNKEEDELNRSVRNLLEMAFERNGFVIQDQTQRGYGANQKKPGELDILIKRNGLPVMIIEGLIHKDKARLYEHIEKANERYNFSGCRSIVVIEYVQSKLIDVLSKTAQDLKKYPHITNFRSEKILEEIMMFQGMLGNKTIRVINVRVGY